MNVSKCIMYYLKVYIHVNLLCSFISDNDLFAFYNTYYFGLSGRRKTTAARRNAGALTKFVYSARAFLPNATKRCTTNPAHSSSTSYEEGDGKRSFRINK